MTCSHEWTRSSETQKALVAGSWFEPELSLAPILLTLTNLPMLAASVGVLHFCVVSKHSS